MRPLVWATLALISGIVLQEWGHFGYPVVLCVLAVSFTFLAATGLWAGAGSLGRFRAVPVFVAVGMAVAAPYADPRLGDDHLANLIGEPGVTGPLVGPLGYDVTGVIDAQPEVRPGRTRLFVDARWVVGADGARREVSGRVMVTVLSSEVAEEKGLGPGDTVRFMGELSRPRNFGNPGEFDYARWLNDRGVFVTGFVKSPALVAKTADAEAGPLAKLRARLRGFIDSSGVENPGAMKALLTGDGHAVPEATRKLFSRTGTAHVLAISGLHVGTIAFFAYGLLMAAFRRWEGLMLRYDVKRLALTLSIIPMVFYALVAGFPLSTQRAAVMVGAFIVSFAAGRGRDHYNTLALAALVVLVASPASLWEASFQMSFAAVLAIIYLVPRMERAIAVVVPAPDSGPNTAVLVRGGRRITTLFLVTLAAAAGTAPVVAQHFHQASPGGLVANLAVVPLAGFLVPLLFMSSLLLPVWEAGAALTLHGADSVFSAMTAVSRAVDLVPGSGFRVVEPGLAGTVFFYGAVVSAAAVARKRALGWAAGACVVLLAAAWWSYPIERSMSEYLRVTFLSVGQGDSALVEFPGGGTMLVDGGGLRGIDVGDAVVGDYLRHRGVRRLDYIVLSHPQRDHMGGLESVVEDFDVGRFWWSGTGGAEGLGRLGKILEGQGVEVRAVGAGATMKPAEGVSVEVIHPGPDAPPGWKDDVNGMSVVMRIEYGERSFLFTGDIGAEQEGYLLKTESYGLDADVVKVPHHGSRTSSSPDFVSRAGPTVAVVSAGRYNPFGFPDPAVVERYENAGAEVFRTDIHGAVTVATDGETLSATSYLTPHGR